MTEVRETSTCPQQLLPETTSVLSLPNVPKATQYNTIYNTMQYKYNTTNTIQYNTLPNVTVQYNTTQYNTKQYNTIQYNKIQYNTVYNTTQYNAMDKDVVEQIASNSMKYIAA